MEEAATELGPLKRREIVRTVRDYRESGKKQFYEA
jgi:hypothetical protein